MSISKPPQTLAQINKEVLSEGTCIHRVHKSEFLANSFNPCKGGIARFSPIKDKEGECIPSLYTAFTLEASVYETIFHDISASEVVKSVPIDDIICRSHSKLQVKRDLQLASLREPDLKALNTSCNQLIVSSAEHYDQTAQWAEAIHHQYQRLDGLAGTSNKCDPESAYLFFGDRVSSTDLEIVYTRRGDYDIEFLDDVVRLGERSRIEVSISLLNY